MEIKQTIEDPIEPQYQVTVDGEVVVGDPSYMADDVMPEVREKLTFRFDGTGSWNVKVTPLETVPDHRNGALIAVRTGTEFDVGTWEKEDQVAAVDSAHMAFYPLDRGLLDDWEAFWGERSRLASGMAVLIPVDGTLVCSSGLGDGAYDIYVRRDANAQIDGVKVDFTPSDAAMSLLYY